MPFKVHCQGTLRLDRPLEPRYRDYLALLGGGIWWHGCYPERVFKVADPPDNESFPNPQNPAEPFIDALPFRVLAHGLTLEPWSLRTLSEWLQWLKYLIQDFLAPRGYVLEGEMTYGQWHGGLKRKIRVENNTIYHNARYIDVSPELHARLIEVLLRHRCTTPEHVAKLEEQMAHRPILLDRLECLMPEREVCFDAEFGVMDEDYERLVQLFATATQGEWQPEQIRARRGSLTTIDFQWRGEAFHWEFEGNEHSDYVDPFFYDPLGTFERQHLSGSFASLISSDDQMAHLFYLPRTAEEEVREVIREIQSRWYEQTEAFIRYE
jgi:hypothetical protein